MTIKKQETKNDTGFTNEVNANSLTDEEMNQILAQLPESKFWAAILRYNRLVDANTLNSLASLDPFKEPTLVARSQGMRMGLYHLEQTAVRERDERRKVEEGTQVS